MINKTANLLQVIGYLTYVGGFFAGISLANVKIPYTFSSGYYTEFSFTLAVAYWAAFFVSGTLLLGFAEIISLLQELVDKQSMKKAGVKKDKVERSVEEYQDLPEL